MPYSVSPRRFLKISGGKNSAKRSTRMPVFLAAMKWPSSCITTRTMKPSAARTAAIQPLMR